MMRTKKKKNTKKQINQNEGEPVCLFCGTGIICELTLGKILSTSTITVHYFCMLFSSGLVQKGKSDDEGLLGFLPKDILREERRGRRLKCVYCKRPGATIGCTVPHCRCMFHLPCGIKNDTLHQFFDTFCSFCSEHRPQQIVSTSDRLSFHGTANSTCPICLVAVEARTSNYTLRAPCCKNSWFHRICLQRQALNSGYFFKCPLCNNKEIFQAEMLTYGIYIPEQDASWELEENAFQELLYRHNQCDAETCKCSMGRNFEEETGSWEILLCEICGSQGIHKECANLKWFRPTWECSVCQDILSKVKKTVATTSEAYSPVQPSVQESSSKIEEISREEKPAKKKKKKKQKKRKKHSKRKFKCQNTDHCFSKEKRVRISSSPIDEDIDIETFTEKGNSQAFLLSSFVDDSTDSEIEICDPKEEQGSREGFEDDELHLALSPTLSTTSDEIDQTMPSSITNSYDDDDSDVQIIDVKLSPQTTNSFLSKMPCFCSDSSGCSKSTQRNSFSIENTSSSSSETFIENSSFQHETEISDIIDQTDVIYEQNDTEIAVIDKPKKSSTSYFQTTLSPFFRKKIKMQMVECIDLTDSDASIKISNPQCSNITALEPQSLSSSFLQPCSLPVFHKLSKPDCKIEFYIQKGVPSSPSSSSSSSSFNLVVNNKQSLSY